MPSTKRSIPVIAVLLCLAALPAFSKRSASKTDRDRQQLKLFHTKLDKNKQILHALDRLTFGPRPGNVEQVRRMGLRKWIGRQLDPERIPENPTLEARLTPLESLRMTPMEAVQHYPPPQLIKAIAEGRQAMPDDPLLRSAVERLVARYRVKKGEANGKSDPNNLDELEPVKPLDQLLSGDELRTLRSGKPDEKRALLESLPAGELEDIVVALPRGMRQGLFAFAPTDVKRKLLLMNAPQQVVAYDLLASKILRAVYSNRQLAEELDDFWFNHFNVFYDKGADRFLIPAYERDVIRPHILGKFRDLLEATAKSPAMLFYLDNFQSVGPESAANARAKKKRGLNENYGRELMELHTLGVDGGYTQKDVTEVARCFTGWTIRDPRRGGDFFYNDRLHDKGEKVVLGVTIPAGGGMEDGEKVLDILTHHPSTAHFISQELAQRFVADNPPAELVDRMAATFLKTDGDIREVMRTMLESKEFWSAGSYHAKVKTPFEMAVSAVRALNANVEDAFALANQVGNLGEPLYRKQEPTGYSNINTEWVNSAALLGRMNFALNLAQNRVPGVKVDASRLPEDPVQIGRRLMSADVSPQTKASIEKALKNEQTKNPRQQGPALLAGLVLGSPDFQRR